MRGLVTVLLFLFSRRRRCLLADLGLQGLRRRPRVIESYTRNHGGYGMVTYVQAGD